MTEVVSSTLTTSNLNSITNGPKTDAKMIQEDFSNKLDQLTEQIDRLQVHERHSEVEVGSQASFLTSLSHDPFLFLSSHQQRFSQEPRHSNVHHHQDSHSSNDNRENSFSRDSYLLVPSISNESTWTFIN